MLRNVQQNWNNICISIRACFGVSSLICIVYLWHCFSRFFYRPVAGFQFLETFVIYSSGVNPCEKNPTVVPTNQPSRQNPLKFFYRQTLCPSLFRSALHLTSLLFCPLCLMRPSQCLFLFFVRSSKASADSKLSFWQRRVSPLQNLFAARGPQILTMLNSSLANCCQVCLYVRWHRRYCTSFVANTRQSNCSGGFWFSKEGKLIFSHNIQFFCFKKVSQ